MQLDSEHMKNRGLDIRSFYSEKTNYAVFDNYYIFEPLLTAPHPSVKEFDKEGQPIYEGFLLLSTYTIRSKSSFLSSDAQRKNQRLLSEVKDNF